jgi:hypothetical protein
VSEFAADCTASGSGHSEASVPTLAWFSTSRAAGVLPAARQLSHEHIAVRAQGLHIPRGSAGFDRRTIEVTGPDAPRPYAAPPEAGTSSCWAALGEAPAPPAVVAKPEPDLACGSGRFTVPRDIRRRIPQRGLASCVSGRAIYSKLGSVPQNHSSSRHPSPGGADAGRLVASRRQSLHLRDRSSPPASSPDREPRFVPASGAKDSSGSRPSACYSGASEVAVTQVTERSKTGT